MLMMCLPPVPPRSHLVEDFSDRAAGSLIGQGWSHLDATTNVTWTVEADTGSLSGRRVVVDKTTSDGLRRVVLDRVGVVGDVEVLARVKFTEEVNFENGQTYIRANSAPDGIFANVTGTSVDGSEFDNKLIISELTGASSVDNLNAAAFTHAVDVWYWVRVRGISTAFSAKIWESGTSEPAFMVSDTEAGAPATGSVGMGCFESGDNYVFDYFSVAVGGSTAPGPAG